MSPVMSIQRTWASARTVGSAAAKKITCLKMASCQLNAVQTAVTRMHSRQPPKSLPPEQLPAAVLVYLDKHREEMSADKSSTNEF